MKTYLAGYSLLIPLSLVDSEGAAVASVDDLTYSLTDESGVELAGATSLTLTAGAAVIAIDVSLLEIPEGSVRTARTIEIKARRGAPTVSPIQVEALELEPEGFQIEAIDQKLTIAHIEFLVESPSSLVIANNSFQTYTMALINAQDLTSVDAFTNAERKSRISALANAFRSLCGLSYQVDERNIARLTTLSLVQMTTLPTEFLKALRLAQILEAAESLNPDSIHRKRQEGLMSETIGESSMMFRPEKVLTVPITRRSLDILRPYLTWEIGVGRG